MKLNDYECAACGKIVKDVESTDDMAVAWVHCPVCDKLREMVKLPGGHVSKTSAAAWRSSK